MGDYGHIIYSTPSINLILQKGEKSNISFQSHDAAQCIYLCKALIIGVSFVSQRVNNLPIMQKNRIRSLDQEDPLESRQRLPIPVFLPGEFHGREAEGLQSMGSQTVQQDSATNTFTD